MLKTIPLALPALLLSHSLGAQPSLTVSPPEAVYDAPFEVELSGVPAHEEVEIRTLRATEDGAVWVTSAAFRADARGTINSAAMPSIAGSYTGLSPHGLLCSALPEGAGGFAAYSPRLLADPRLPRSYVPPIGPIPITVEARIDGKVVASKTAVRGHAMGVVEQEVATGDGLRGVYFRPAAGRPARTPVILLNGSGGGVRRYGAARLASHGHPTFAMALYNYADLTKSLKNIPIERVRDGARWLAGQTGAAKVAVMGVSRGSEAAAHAAIAFPEDFSAVILSVPSHLADGGALGPDAATGDSAWTLAGEPLPVTDLGFSFNDPRIAELAKELPGYNASGMVLSLWGSERLEAAYGTRFEEIEAPVLVLAGAEDGIWPSWISAERIRQRLAAAGKGDRVDVRTYAGAGHSLVAVGFGGPYSTYAYNPGLKGYMDFGGTPNGNCDAGFESSRAIVEFLASLDAPMDRE